METNTGECPGYIFQSQSQQRGNSPCEEVRGEGEGTLSHWTPTCTGAEPTEQWMDGYKAKHMHELFIHSEAKFIHRMSCDKVTLLLDQRTNCIVSLVVHKRCYTSYVVSHLIGLLQKFDFK